MKPTKRLSERMPAVDGYAHVTLPIHDLEVAERFYVGVLGAKLLRKFDRNTFVEVRPDRAHEADADNSPLHLAVVFPDAPELHLFLQRGCRRSAPVPHPHIAMNVDHDELDRCVANLARAGVPVDGPRRLGPPGHASVYFADPSGNLLEFVTTGYRGAVEHGPPDVSKLGWEA
jgi:catechol 2,3-dioxygenase-like lactoylglutathione lyase family enzyme